MGQSWWSPATPSWRTDGAAARAHGGPRRWARAAEAKSGPARTAFNSSGPLPTELTAAIDRHRLLESGASGHGHFTSDVEHPFVGRVGAFSKTGAPEAARMPRMVPQGAYRRSRLISYQASARSVSMCIATASCVLRFDDTEADSSEVVSIDPTDARLRNDCAPLPDRLQEASCPEKPSCRPGQVHRLVNRIR